MGKEVPCLYCGVAVMKYPSRSTGDRFCSRSCATSWANKKRAGKHKLPRKDMAGKRFGRLVVLREHHIRRRADKREWLCKCDCGTEKSVLQNSLVSGSTTSCGCLHREIVSRITYKHGLSKTREYYVMRSAKRRQLVRDVTQEVINPEEVRKHLVGVYGDACLYCGKPEYESIDHFVPLSRGGLHNLENLRPSCAKCNSSKGSKLFEEWNAIR